MGIHLLECSNPEKFPKKKTAINPSDNHISFQTSDMNLVARKLDDMGIDYVIAAVEEGGITVDQIFFHDPDGYMVEVCNCQILPICPISQSCRLPPPLFQNLMVGAGDPVSISLYLKDLAIFRCASEVGNRMMESLVAEIMNISF